MVKHRAGLQNQRENERRRRERTIPRYSTERNGKSQQRVEETDENSRWVKKYGDEVMNNLEEVLKAENKFQKQQKKVVLWEEFTRLEKLDGKVLDLMTEFEDMDIDKEMRSASKLRADMHLGMIQIDEALANMTPAASTT